MFDSPIDEIISVHLEEYTTSIGLLADIYHTDTTFLKLVTKNTLSDELEAPVAYYEMKKISNIFAKFLDKYLFDYLISHKTSCKSIESLRLSDIITEPSVLYYPLRIYSDIHTATLDSVFNVPDEDCIHTIGSPILNDLNCTIQLIGDDIVTRYKITHNEDEFTMEFKVFSPENIKIHVITNVCKIVLS